MAFFVSCFLWPLTSPYSTNISASPIVFTINTSSSQLTASGDLFGNPFAAQGPGSLTTSFSGTINANLTGSNIQFTGGSLIAAQTNGIWQPAVGGVPGSAPADFGGTNNAVIGIGPNGVPGNFALRNLLLDLTSPQLMITNGGFDGSSLTFVVVTNTASIDYYYSQVGATTNGGSKFLNGYSTNGIGSTAILSTNAGMRQLVLQVHAWYYSKLFITPNDASINLTGQLVATNALPAPPIIQSIVRARPNVLITTKNTTAQSVLMISTNLTTWTAASATISTNGSGMIVFTTPSTISPGQAFYRVQQ